MKKYDYVIVGAGLYGAVFAYLAKKDGKKCLVLDRRPQTGGNLYCEKIEGINIHKYGAHIFHTSNKEVWEFVNSIVEFNRYTNSPVANYKGNYFNLPFNMNTFYQMWGVTTPSEAKVKIEDQKQEALEKMKTEGITEPRNLEEQALLLIGKDIYEKLIKGYTEKQWGRSATEIPAFIIKRLPVRFVYDNNYFNDKYQGIPIGGYNELIEGLLKDVEVRCDVDFLSNKSYYENLGEKILFTGAIDEFFGYEFGKLAYRTIHFEHEIHDVTNWQGNAVVNYTESEIPFTRIIEHKHFEMFGEEVENCPKTFISKEFSSEWKEGMEPYYPINDDENNALYQKYKELSEKETQYLFGGRLAEYKYYDMAPIVELVLSRYKNLK
ncbi:MULTISPECIES: UDP-galactopyranose mutase [Chryseobacterium]|uniref:UDP-galactopyranose mutase n=1 Tax=Chryseobacterium TaxID=59732 RepID=UPI000C9DEAA4|nr:MULTISPECIES: UDP-galactopyranose mutase [Chryseobacterium]VXC58009.1 UDP-galactopyranose mutase, FAD/NAD(P)-binding [Chryseobacterium sp. 8AT]